MSQNRAPRRVTGTIEHYDPTTGEGEVSVGGDRHSFHGTSFSSPLGDGPAQADEVDVFIQEGCVLRVRGRLEE